MTNSYYCTNQQIINWHYGTVCRYQLITKPTNLGVAYFLKQMINKVEANRFSNSKNIYKQLQNFLPITDLFLSYTQEKKNPSSFLSSNLKPSALCSHVVFWKHINQITFHITSGKLLSNIELYPSFYMALSCFGNQGPQMIRSKKAVAEFSIVKSAIIGARSNLQKRNKFLFLYKWVFIAVGTKLPLSITDSRRFVSKLTNAEPECFGVSNIFIFPELDKYNYYLFEEIGGFDLMFTK